MDFRNDENTLNLMEPHDILSSVQSLDAQAFNKMMFCLDDESSTDRKAIMSYLREYERPLFDFLSQYESMHQEAAVYIAKLAQEAKQVYLANKTVRQSYEHALASLTQTSATSTDSGGKKGAKEKKRPADDEAQVLLDSPPWKRTQQPVPSREPLSDAFPLQDYVQLATKSNKQKHKPLSQNDGWFWVYHTTSKWEAEELAWSLEDKGLTAIVVKKKRGSADMECHAYKVLTLTDEI